MTMNTFQGSGTPIPLDKLSLGRSAELDIEKELAAFEAEERAKLGLDAETLQYVEPIFDDPTTANKAHTTILLSGLTMAQDYLVGGALSGLGFHVVNLDCPDHESLRYGKEFGNRGQCNPTYFTVGNLVKVLCHMRDVKGMSTEEIIDRYVFLTAGSCGPCRFGMYVTEYRKALCDAGFEGFRVLLFQMNGGIKQASGEESEGLTFNPGFFWALAKAMLTGDALNVLGYRIRPYEVEQGATDRAMEQAKKLIYDALHDNTSFLRALYQARKVMSAVEVDRTRVKPKVGITGEFWAMTTEGDGNYQMQRFLQEEGAEVDTPILTSWILFMVWEVMRDTKHRMTLPVDDEGRKGLSGVDVRKRLASVWAADKALRLIFNTIAKTLGLHDYHLPQIEEVAAVAGDFYNHDLRGGESYLEVGKVIMNVVNQKVNMTLSIKPFGCMPSSGVSDGVQSAITELYPDAIFLPVETTGDGAVNVYSRVQMMLFKARQAAEREVQEVLDSYGMSAEEAQRIIRWAPGMNSALYHPPHRHGSTAADMVERAAALRHPLKALARWRDHRKNKRGYKKARHVAAA